MINNKNGFTLIEIIVIMVLLILISSMLIINFTKNLHNSNDVEYQQSKTNIEAAADAYVTTNIGKENIDLVLENNDTFTYIAVDELISAGFLNDYPINPKTGEKMNKVVKFSIDANGIYHFEYTEEEGYIIIKYNANGATNISRTAQAFVCKDNNSLIDCIKGGQLPNITRKNGTVIGWSIDKNKKEKDGSSLEEIIRNTNYQAINNKLNLYAITKETKTVNLNKNMAAEINGNNSQQCDVYNKQTSCEIILPGFSSQQYHVNNKWNTKPDGSGKSFDENKEITVEEDMTLYAMSKVEDFNILVNKINRVSSRSTTPANINIVLVLDRSGSMASNNRLNNLKKVCIGLIERMNLDNSTLSLITFGTSANSILSLSQNRTIINDNINAMTASGGTNFQEATILTNYLLTNINNNKKTYVIFVSDGIPTISAKPNDIEEMHKKAKVYAMAIGASGNSVQLKSIATDESTYYTYNDSADDLSLNRFYGLFEDIIQDLLIVNGDGIENAISQSANEGIVSLGSHIILQDKYPLDVFLEETLIETYKAIDKKYLYKDGDEYKFNAFDFANDYSSVDLKDREKLRIRYFDKVDS